MTQLNGFGSLLGVIEFDAAVIMLGGELFPCVGREPDPRFLVTCLGIINSLLQISESLQDQSNTPKTYKQVGLQSVNLRQIVLDQRALRRLLIQLRLIADRFRS